MKWEWGPDSGVVMKAVCRSVFWVCFLIALPIPDVRHDGFSSCQSVTPFISLGSGGYPFVPRHLIFCGQLRCLCPSVPHKPT